MVEGFNTTKSELINRSLSWLHLYGLNDEQKQILNQRLTSSRGTCQLWIHPFYNEDSNNDPQMTIYQERRRKLIQNSIRSNVPIIVFIPYQTSYI